LLGAEEMSLLNEMANDISFALDHLKKEQQVYYLAYFDALDLRVVAAGVETAEQASLLRLLRCHEIQGYLFSPAVPAEQIEVFLREGKRL
jgi:EAL domain-containing protein (putative c-di-GMP-specific phosphodiesterase class I)